MKTISAMTMALLMTMLLRAQDTPPRKAHPAIRTAHRSPAFVLQKKPSVHEIANLFVRTEVGEIDPFELIGMLAAKKDTVVPVLAELLFSPGIKGKKDRPAKVDTLQIIDAAAPNGIYAILALQAIGTNSAYDIILKAAAGIHDKEVRGVALHSVGTSYYFKTCNENISPDKEIVHLFLRNLDDSEEVSFLQKDFAEVSKEGLKNWTGKDGATFQRNERPVAHGGVKKSMTPRESRESWWSKFATKVKWNKANDKFEWATK